MDREKEFIHLLPSLYASAADPHLWQEFLHKLLELTHAHTGMVLAFDNDSLPVLATQLGVDDKTQSSYREYFFATDIIRERIAALAPAKEAWVCRREQLVSDRELENNEFYNDYMRPQNLYHQMGTTMGEAPGFSVGGLSILRAKHQGAFDDSDIAFLQMIAPHMRTAFLLDRKLRTLELQERTLEQVSAEDQLAFLAIDSRRRVVLHSAAAEHILSVTPGLRIAGGELRATSATEDSRLQPLIDGALSVAFSVSGTRDLHPTSGSVRIARKGKQPVQISVAPLVQNRPLLQNSALFQAAIVFLTLPDAPLKPRGAVLRELFGLAPAEARLADCLLHGLGLREAAEALSITENSARFMLKQIFLKTGVRSQSALMRLMLAMRA